MNYRSEGDNKTQYKYINNLLHGLSSNRNICKIFNKICDCQNESAENIWVNTIDYLIVSNQYDCITLNYQSCQNTNLTWNINSYIPHFCER